MTGKEMCETIERAGFLRKPDGSRPTALEIWNYSSAGELSKIFEWYEMAKVIMQLEPIIIELPVTPKTNWNAAIGSDS